jgi:hemoglobin/transferrin/lactoferrin receptor protein
LGIRGNLHQSNLSFENNAGITWPSSYTDGSLQIINQSLVGSIAYQKQLSKTIQTTLSVSNAYRAPNIDDLAKIRVKGEFANIPNPNIKPERTTAIEWGVDYAGPNTEIKHQVFYNIVNDLLVRRTSEQVVVDGFTSLINENTTQGFIAGSTSYLHQNLGNKVSLDVNYTYTVGRTFFQQSNPDMDTVVAMGHIPPFFGSAALTWASQALEMKLSWRFNGRKALRDYEVVDIITNPDGEQVIIRAGSSDNIEFGNVFESAAGPEYGDLPAWQVFDLHWLYKQENRTFFMSIENLLDLHYRTFSSGISASGRNFNLGIIINY